MIEWASKHFFKGRVNRRSKSLVRRHPCGYLAKGTITHVKAAVAIGDLEGMEMGKKWAEERKTEDLWVGRKG